MIKRNYSESNFKRKYDLRLVIEVKWFKINSILIQMLSLGYLTNDFITENLKNFS